MQEIQTILQYRGKIERGGKETRLLAEEMSKARSTEQCKQLAYQLFTHEHVAVKMVAVFLFGILAAQDDETLTFLKHDVSQEQDWRIQEILAQAFHQYCSTSGYEHAIPTIEAWLHDNHPHVRRAAAEGPRIWTSRPYFKDHPQQAIDLLSPLKADESEYVRKSVGNSLRDISRKYPDLLRAELKSWNINDKKILFTYTLVSKFIV